jgi:hypothetical protein
VVDLPLLGNLQNLDKTSKTREWQHMPRIRIPEEHIC